MEKDYTTFYVDFGGSCLYITYDLVRHTAAVVGSGQAVVMPEERVREFVQIAKTLGLKAGTM